MNIEKSITDLEAAAHKLIGLLQGNGISEKYRGELIDRYVQVCNDIYHLKEDSNKQGML